MSTTSAPPSDLLDQADNLLSQFKATLGAHLAQVTAERDQLKSVLLDMLAGKGLTFFIGPQAFTLAPVVAPDAANGSTAHVAEPSALAPVAAEEEVLQPTVEAPAAEPPSGGADDAWLNAGPHSPYEGSADTIFPAEADPQVA